MATSTTATDAETREAASPSRGQRDAGRRDQATAPALHDLVRSISEGIRLFIPPAVLKPESAIRVSSSVLEQVVELQRTFIDELLSAGRDVVVSSDIALWEVGGSNGRRVAA